MTRPTDRIEIRRAAIAAAIADHLLAHGIAAASVRPLAKAAGISDRMLLYYFRDKAEVLAVALEAVAERQMTALGSATDTPVPLPELRARLAATLLADDAWPFMRLWLEIAALAAQGDSALAAIGERIGRAFLAWGAAQLVSDTPEIRSREAAQLLVSIEGMVLLKAIDMEDVARLAQNR